jgi:hypothetical protein
MANGDNPGSCKVGILELYDQPGQVMGLISSLTSNDGSRVIAKKQVSLQAIRQQESADEGAAVTERAEPTRFEPWACSTEWLTLHDPAAGQVGVPPLLGRDRACPCCFFQAVSELAHEVYAAAHPLHGITGRRKRRGEALVVGMA